MCGCAVVARDLASLREIWGDDALYFRDANGLSRQVERLAGDPELLTTMQTRAKERAATFTVERMTDGYLGLLAELGVPTAAPAKGEHVA